MAEPASDALLDSFRALLGPARVLTGADTAAWTRDWTGQYAWTPRAVLRPGSTAEVAAVLRLAAAARAAIVPAGGRTGLVGGAEAEGRLVLSLDRLSRIRALRAAARVVVAEAGVTLAALHDAAAAQGLVFPLTFGARGSATVGGVLSTNAGGSNVLRYGSTRGLCLGIEAVLADGRVLDLMSELRKDNTGYDLRDLFIGAEGTLGVITAAVFRLFPAPRAYATATVAMTSLDDALDLLNRLQAETGGAVEAFEYMPARYIDRLAEARPDLGAPFAGRHPVTLLVEVGATAPADAEPAEDGSLPVAARLEATLAAAMERGVVADAVVARSEEQRRRMWARREAAAEITVGRGPMVDCDVALPLEAVKDFLAGMQARLAAIDPGATDFVVAHLGDGNIHWSAYVTRDDPALEESIRTEADALAVALGGSFSAEHGIGLTKLSSMRRHKDPVALDVMRRIKAALDPDGILNPGKVLPG